MSAATRLDALLDPSVQQRIFSLGELANEGCLSPDEREEYEALIDAADFISILKLKARRHLDQSPQ